MKNTGRKFAAPLALLLAALTLTGCYSEKNSWAARKGDLTLPIGGYIYYLSSAAGSARAEVPTGQDVLKSEIDGESADAWIRSHVEDSVKNFFYVNEKFDEMGLTLSDDDRTMIETNTNSMWGSYGSGLESSGISKETFNLIFSTYSVKQSRIFDALYGPDGEKGVTDDELSAYYTDNYYSYEYFTVTVPTKPVENNDDTSSTVVPATEVDEEAKAKLRKQLDDYSRKIKNGDMTVSEAAGDYASANGLENSTYIPYTGKISDAYGAVAEAMLGAKDDDIVIVESTTASLVLAHKKPIRNETSGMLGSESSRESVLSDMKWSEFIDGIRAEADKTEGIEYNETAINAHKPSDFLSGDNKKGSKTVESEVSTASEASEVSSESSAGSDE